MKETITYYEKKLKLSQSLIEFYETTEFHDKDQFVLELLKKLYQERRENIIERNLKAAKFPLFKTFEGYSFAGLDFPDTLSAENLKTLDFISNKENLILYGGVGTGKTHLSIAIGLSVIKSGKQVYFYTLHDLINHLVKAKEQNQLEKAMNKLIKAELLIHQLLINLIFGFDSFLFYYGGLFPLYVDIILVFALPITGFITLFTSMISDIYILANIPTSQSRIKCK